MPRPRFRALQVHQTATQLLRTPRLHNPPPWYDAIGTVPPAQPVIRSRPVQHHEAPRRIKTKKASKLFMPQSIHYEEDILRREFFGDHPWELARPRVVLETDGKNGQGLDWAQIKQSGRTTDGESVIQRQLWLMDNVPEMTKAKAYDQARQEFYAIRHQEDVERRVAKEEALATGAHFGKTSIEVGMELEKKAYEEWRAWAVKTQEVLEQTQGALQQGLAADEVAEEPTEVGTLDRDEIVEEPEEETVSV